MFSEGFNLVGATWANEKQF